MNPESIYYLFEVGNKDKQEDYIWPVAGKATEHDKVFIVCDGAGSFSNGGIASRLICQFMAAKVSKFDEQKMSGELIEKLLIEARERLITYAREYRLDTDLATTFAMLILYDQKVFMSWSGDSRIYHLRRGEILFRTEDNLPVHEPIQLSEVSGDNNRLLSRNTAIARGIKADDSPIYVETKWIEDVQDGDYFLLCSKGLVENVREDYIEVLVKHSDKADIDLSGSFKRLAVEKTPDNYSMYLIKVNTGSQKRGIKSGINTIRKRTREIKRPIFIALVAIVVVLSVILYFKEEPTTYLTPEYKKDSTQRMEFLRDDTVPSALVVLPRRKLLPVVTDTVKSNNVMPPVTDTVKSNSEKLQPPLQDDNSAVIQTDEKPQPTSRKGGSAAIQAEESPEQIDPAPRQTTRTPRQTNQTPISKKELVGQMLIKFTTDESCKLKITNTDLDNVIDWDLSENDNGTIYLKPGKYTIVATSVISSSKTKTYNFDVKSGETNTTQNIHIRF